MDLEHGRDGSMQIVGFWLGCIVDVDWIPTTRDCNGSGLDRFDNVEPAHTVIHRGVIEVFAELFSVHGRTRDQ